MTNHRDASQGRWIRIPVPKILPVLDQIVMLLKTVTESPYEGYILTRLACIWFEMRYGFESDPESEVPFRQFFRQVQTDKASRTSGDSPSSFTT